MFSAESTMICKGRIGEYFKKLLGIICVCAIVLNIYQYQSHKLDMLITHANAKQPDSVVSETYANYSSPLRQHKALELAEVPSINDTATVNSTESTPANRQQHSETIQDGHSENQDDFFEYELSMYLDETVVQLLRKRQIKTSTKLLRCSVVMM